MIKMLVSILLSIFIIGTLVGSHDIGGKKTRSTQRYTQFTQKM